MKTLIIDTETSSLPNKSIPLDHPEQARILQFAGIMLDSDLNEAQIFYTLVNHEDSIVIHPGAAAVHGITKEMCQKYGMPVRLFTLVLQHMCNGADRIVAHNLGFDKQLVDAELILGGSEPVDWLNVGYCTMLTLTPICRLSNAKRGGYKWPKLEEALQICCGESVPDAHDALADCKSAAKLYKWLQRNKTSEPLQPVLTEQPSQ